MAELVEVVLTTEELLTAMSSEDVEFRDVDQKAQLQRQIDQLRKNREENIKQSIQGMMVTLEEELCIIEQASGEGAGNVEESDDLQVEKAKQHKEEISQQVAALRGQEAACQKEKEKLAEQHKQVAANNNSLPSLRHDLNLYSHISNIRWQYDCDPHEVKGYVCNLKSARPFSLSTKDNSQFFVVNYLWDLMDPDW